MFGNDTWKCFVMYKGKYYESDLNGNITNFEIAHHSANDAKSEAESYGLIARFFVIKDEDKEKLK